jgi:hypothetical protein
MEPPTRGKRKRADSSPTSSRHPSPGTVDGTSELIDPPDGFAEFLKVMSERGKKKEKEKWPALMTMVSISSIPIEMCY